MFWYDSLTSSMVGVVEKASQYDSDGIDIYFFNSQVVEENVRTANDIRSLFRRVEPRRSTPTAKAIKRVLEPYLQKLEAANRAKENGQALQPVKPLNLVILTGMLCRLDQLLHNSLHHRRRTRPGRGA